MPLHDGSGVPILDDDGDMTYDRVWHEHTSYGLVAEDVAAVWPIGVKLDSQGKPDGIEWNRITTLLIAEMQQLRRRVAVLEAA
jgi:hypothetical protein